MSISGTAYSTLQQGSRGATGVFNRFVEGEDHHPNNASRAPLDPDKRDFWDSFAAAGEEHTQQKKNEPERKDFWDDFAEIGKQKQEPERKEFWDEFSNAGAAKAAQQQAGKAKSSIGTAAMGRRKPAEKKEEEGWGDW
jgi:ADP-ribosylation factor GTPase-activating protein 1